MQPSGLSGFVLKIVKISANSFVFPVPPNKYGNLKLASNDPVAGIKKELVQSSRSWEMTKLNENVCNGKSVSSHLAFTALL